MTDAHICRRHEWSTCLVWLKGAGPIKLTYDDRLILECKKCGAIGLRRYNDWSVVRVRAKWAEKAKGFILRFREAAVQYRADRG